VWAWSPSRLVISTTWIGGVGAGEVRRLAPEGSLVDRIAVPAPHIASVAFAGDGLDLLMITTARSELSDDQLSASPDSGRLFAVRVDTPGLPVAPQAGHAGPSIH
jgi:sugar lactone lactonase YvrE